jgi:prepilin-type processing-associated H-X9-DG protein
MANIRVPADTVLSVETDVTNKSSLLYSPGPGWGGAPVMDLNANPPYMGFDGGYYRIVGRHQLFTNVVFCDGHVKAMRIDQLFRRRRNNDPNGAMSYFTVQED